MWLHWDIEVHIFFCFLCFANLLRQFMRNVFFQFSSDVTGLGITVGGWKFLMKKKNLQKILVAFTIAIIIFLWWQPVGAVGSAVFFQLMSVLFFLFLPGFFCVGSPFHPFFRIFCSNPPPAGSILLCVCVYRPKIERGRGSEGLATPSALTHCDCIIVCAMQLHLVNSVVVTTLSTVHWCIAQATRPVLGNAKRIFGVAIPWESESKREGRIQCFTQSLEQERP